MVERTPVLAAVVDYGLGNLFSVRQACLKSGMRAVITSSASAIEEADAVILPGVGAFGDAMDALRMRNLVQVLREVAASQKPLLGICLGMQLLMEESFEFGRHPGLGIVEGQVIRIPREGSLKIPHVGWNRVYEPTRKTSGNDPTWSGTLMAGLVAGEYLYFVHSYVVAPVEEKLIVSMTRYGSLAFCSALKRGSVFGCQFHPERSGDAGLRIYRNLALLAQREKGVIE